MAFTMGQHGMAIDPRHTMLLADNMTYKVSTPAPADSMESGGQLARSTALIVRCTCIPACRSDRGGSSSLCCWH